MSNSAPSETTTVDWGTSSLSAFLTAAIDDVVTLSTREPMPTMRSDAPAIAVTRKNMRRSTAAGAVAVVGAADQRRSRETRWVRSTLPAIVPTIGGIDASGVAPARVTMAAIEMAPAMTSATTPRGGLMYCAIPAIADAISTEIGRAHV